MSLETILVSADVGVITSAITAYITTRFKMKEERAKWQREFAVKFAEAQGTDNAGAQRMAVQFAIGVLIFENVATKEREKIFVPPNCRLVAGRSSDNPIYVNDPRASRHHCAFDADDKNVYVEDLGAANAVFINGAVARGKHMLETGDVTLIGATEFLFHKLDKR